jgi:ribosomal protein S18 acetylase RimI-like enzyme
MIEQIHTMPPQRMEESARILAEAFQDDPLFKYALLDERKRQMNLVSLFKLNVRYGLQFGEVHSIPGAGIAIWLPPGQSKISVPRALRAGMWMTPFIIGLKAVLRLGQYNGVSESLHTQFAPDLHWYLFLLAVKPAFQGRGLGSRLLEHGLDRADASHMPCALETNNPSAVPFYQKHGFELAARHQLNAAGLNLWSMRRAGR